MAATANQNFEFQRPEVSMPRPPIDIAAATEIFKHTFVVIDGSGDAIPGLTTGANVFYGVAKEYTNNTGAISTNKPMEVETIGILKHAVTGATATTIGAAVFYTDDDALSMTIVGGTGVAGSTVGRHHGFHEDGTALVDMTKVEF